MENDGSTHFHKSLLKNVEHYKQIHFTWNIRNLKREQFISLRLRENEDDENLFGGIETDWNRQYMDYTNIIRDNTTESKLPKISYSSELHDMSSKKLYPTTRYGYKELFFRSKMDSHEKLLSPKIMKLVTSAPVRSKRKRHYARLVNGKESKRDKEPFFQSESNSNEELLSPQIMKYVTPTPDKRKRKRHDALVKRTDSKRDKEPFFQSEKDSNEELLSPQIMKLVTADLEKSKRKRKDALVERTDSKRDKEPFYQSEMDSNEEVLSPQIMKLVTPDLEKSKKKRSNALIKRTDSKRDNEPFLQSEMDSNEELLSPQIMKLVTPDLEKSKRKMNDALVERTDSKRDKEPFYQSEMDSNEEVLSPQIMKLVTPFPDKGKRERNDAPLVKRRESKRDKDIFFQSELDSSEELLSPQIMKLVTTAPGRLKRKQHHARLVNGKESKREKEPFFQSEMDSSEELLSPQIMKYVTPIPDKRKRKRHDALIKRKEVTTDRDSQEPNVWFTVVNHLVKEVPTNSKQYYDKWKETIKLFTNDTMSRKMFINMFPKSANRHLIEDISQRNVFLPLFWPLVFENAFMNQKLGLLGLSGKQVPRQRQKMTFFEELEKVSTIKVPVNEHQILLSFNDSNLVEALNRAGLLESSLEFVEAGHHLFTTKEQSLITRNVNAAMDHINKTSPELYLAINQLIGCIAFYKAERPGYAGGTISSALGVTWQDPRFYEESSVRYYAEQIVHEFIHTSLFLADLVHGLYFDHRKFSEAKVYSPIRNTLRNYDKTFHASYVSTGLVAFHARAGHWDRVEKFATPLLLSIDELIKVNQEFGVLTEAGEATLDAMVDFLTVIRLRN